MALYVHIIMIIPPCHSGDCGLIFILVTVRKPFLYRRVCIGAECVGTCIHVHVGVCWYKRVGERERERERGIKDLILLCRQSTLF